MKKLFVLLTALSLLVSTSSLVLAQTGVSTPKPAMAGAPKTHHSGKGHKGTKKSTAKKPMAKATPQK